MAEIVYRNNIRITGDDFIDLLKRSTLSERRPVNDISRIQKMIDHANVIITAWAGDKLVGVSRAVTDFSFCCYLSDLAVDQSYQHQGIGKQLITETQRRVDPECMMVLLAAPKANDYYPKRGVTHNPRAWMLKSDY